MRPVRFEKFAIVLERLPPFPPVFGVTSIFGREVDIIISMLLNLFLYDAEDSPETARLMLSNLCSYVPILLKSPTLIPPNKIQPQVWGDCVGRFYLMGTKLNLWSVVLVLLK